MKLQVVAMQRGSFGLVLQGVVALVPDLLTHISEVVSSFKTLVDIIKLKRDLKGKSLKKSRMKAVKVKSQTMKVK